MQAWQLKGYLKFGGKEQFLREKLFRVWKHEGNFESLLIKISEIAEIKQLGHPPFPNWSSHFNLGKDMASRVFTG